MENRRRQRLEKELREVVANYLITGLRGELEGLVTVSRVQAAPDLKSAKILVSHLGTDEQRDISLDVLDERVRDIQDEVAHKLKLRYTPKLAIELDASLEKQLKVEGILRNLEMGRAAKNALPDKGASGPVDDDE